MTTPAARVPSHGTDMLGQRYAYDSSASTTAGATTCRRPSHLGGGVPTRECYAWGSPIHCLWTAR